MAKKIEIMTVEALAIICKALGVNITVETHNSIYGTLKGMHLIRPFADADAVADALALIKRNRALSDLEKFGMLPFFEGTTPECIGIDCRKMIAAQDLMKAGLLWKDKQSA